MIKLGDKVKDQVTGFTGIVVSYTKWLSGCDTVGVQPDKVGKDGLPIQSVNIDITQVDLIKPKLKKIETEKGAPREVAKFIR